jgi:hypothetical protein
MKSRAWLALILAAVAFVQGCAHDRCCCRKPLFPRLHARMSGHKTTQASASCCCEASGFAAVPGHVPMPPGPVPGPLPGPGPVPPPLPLPHGGPPPLAP